MSEENFSGSFQEGEVIRLAAMLGVHVCKYGEASGGFDMFAPIRLIRHVPYINIYDLCGKTEFVLENRVTQHAIRIECKYQNGDGSVEDKLVKSIIELQSKVPENESILLLGGDGFTKEKIAAIKRWALTQRWGPKKVHVFSPPEFHAWFRRYIKEQSA
jgi:hypothetical protein